MTPAEQLIVIATDLKLEKRGKILIPDIPLGDEQFARIALSFRFDRIDPFTKMKAVMENWGWERIIQECY